MNCFHRLQLKDAQFAAESKQRDARQAEEIKQINKKHAQEVESIVEVRIKQERTQEELKHRQELAEESDKHKQELEAIRAQAANFANEKVRQAISERELKHRQTEEEYKSRISRLGEDNKKLQLQVEEQSKKLNQNTGELQGTSGERVLMEELKKEFKTDEITCKRNGVAMADVVQIIITEKGERISTPIVYDKKTSNKVTKADLEKAKNYKRIHNTDHCIIVTTDIKETTPRQFTEVRDGVLLVHQMVVVDVAKRIRSFLLETSKLAKINGGKNSKKDKLYEFFTSSEYNRDRQTRIEAKSKLDELQRNDEEYHRKAWNKNREAIRKWFELDSKLDDFVSDITQEDEDSTKEEDDNSSS